MEQTVRFTLNGKPTQLSLNPLRRLLDVLREDCGLTAIKEGCGEGECGACAILIDGRVVDSCILPVGAAQGREIETLESIRETARGRLIVDGLSRGGGVQCGFCTPGIAVTIEALLRENPNPSEYEIRDGISGNLCRCTGYQQIVEGVLYTAAETRERSR